MLWGVKALRFLRSSVLAYRGAGDGGGGDGGEVLCLVFGFFLWVGRGGDDEDSAGSRRLKVSRNMPNHIITCPFRS